MPADLDDLLEGAVARTDGGLPDAHDTWAAGRRHRTRTRALTGGAAVLALVGAVGLGTLVLDQGPGPAPIIDEPTPTTPEPTPSDAQPSPAPDAEPSPAADDDGVTVPTDAPVDRETLNAEVGARWVAASADGRWLYRSSEDEVPLTAADAVAYPWQLRALPGGAVVWQTAEGRVLALRPLDDQPVVLAEAVEDGNPITLTGTGVVDGVAVAILETSDARSLNDDDGGAVIGRRLDGTDVPIVDVEFSWEYGQGTQAVVDGWRLDATSSEALVKWTLTAPDGATTVLTEGFDGDEGPQVVDMTLTTGTTEGVPWLVTMLREPREDAPFGRTVFEVRDVATGSADDLVVRTEVPALDDGVPKQLQVRDGRAWVTLLPDFPKLARVDLATGEIEEFGAAGVIGIEPDWNGHHDPLAAPFVTAPVTFDGWGPLQLGMPRAEVELALGGVATGECGGGSAAPFGNVSVSYEGEEGDQRLSRIDVYWPRWRDGVAPAPTGRVRLGSFGDEAVDHLGAIGIDAVLEEAPDLLADVDGPEDNTELRVAARRDGRLLAWSVGDDGRINQVRVGTAEATEFMSRCA